MSCQYFFITYNPNTPRACKLYQIQSKDMPDQVIKNATSGGDCLGFKEKVKKQTVEKSDPKRYG
jgi:hypothetical protein